MKRSVLVAAAIVSPVLGAAILGWLYVELAPDPPPPPAKCVAPIGHAAASAGNREVSLTWRLADDQQTAPRSWNYQQYVQGEHGAVERNTGSPATAHVVRGLVNGVTYMFRVQAVLESGDVGCWSESVPALPGDLRDLVERIEQQQQTLVQHTSAIVELTRANGTVLRRLGGRGVAALERLGTSARVIAGEAAGIRGGVDQIATNVDTAGNKVAGGLADIVAALGASPCGKCGGCQDGDGTLCKRGPRGETGPQGSAGETGLRGPEGKRGPAGPAADLLPCTGTSIGRLGFRHAEHRIGTDNVAAFNEIVAKLKSHERGLVLSVGHATSVGFERHNAHLSDLRAACVSQCLRERLGDGKFEYREIARGEALETSDPAGTSSLARRVEVVYCENHSIRPPITEARRRTGSLVTGCGCPASG